MSQSAMYRKVFASLFHGSLIGQSDPQLVLVYLVTHASWDGSVEAHPAEVGLLTGIGEERVHAALAVLEAPDPRSRSGEADGARIEKVGDGYRWQVVNFKRYQGMRNEEDRKRQTRDATERWRAKKRGEPDVSRSEPLRAHIDRDVDIEESTHSSPNGSSDGVFQRIWTAYPHYGRRSSKARSLARWKALKHKPTEGEVMAGIKSCAESDDWTREGGRFVPALEVWIGKRGWDSSNGSEPQEQDPEAVSLARIKAKVEALHAQRS